MSSQVDWQGLIAAISGLLLLIVAAVIVILVVRRRAQQARQMPSDEAFTLEQLRQLYYQGELTEDEFARAKENIFARVCGQAEAPRREGAEGEPDSPGPGTTLS